MSENYQKVPKLRFPGFTDAWEQRRLGEVCNVFRSGDYIKADGIAPTGNYPVYGGNGLRGYTDNFNYDGEFALIGRQGALCGNMQFSYGKAYFTEHAVAVQANGDNETRFLFHLLGAMNLGQYSGQSAQPGLAVGNLVLLSALMPKKAEQSKISSLLHELDTLISFHQRKLKHLAEQKKGLLQKMFPKEGSDRPEIRFPGFTDAWEQRKLGEVADIVGGGTPSTSVADYWGGNIDWYAPAEIGEQIYVSSSQKKITELGFQNSSAKLLPVGTVLFTSRAGIGNTAILSKIGTTNQGFQSVVPHKNEADSYFIFSRTHELKRYAETVGAGSTFVEVSGKQMAQMPILMPEMEEQVQIGAFFSEFDTLIAFHQRKLKHLQKLKKGLLQQMFV